MIFELEQNFHDTLATMPTEHPKRRILGLMSEALRRDIGFLHRHPTCLFQQFWNLCWWYDCPASTAHYKQRWFARFPDRLSSLCRLIGNRQTQREASGLRLHIMMEQWRYEKEAYLLRFVWLRSHRPPEVHLGGGIESVLRGHKEKVENASLSRNGKRVVTRSVARFTGEKPTEDRTARIWDAETGRELHLLRGHKDTLTVASFSNHGSRVVTASKDGTARIWDTDSGQLLHVLRGHNKDVCGASFSVDGSRIITASYDGTARIWDTASGQQLHVLREHDNNYVTTALFSGDGSRIVTTTLDGPARIWDTASGQLIHVLRHGSKYQSRALFSGDGSRIVTTALDGTPRIWDAETGKELHVVRGDSLGITFSPDGSLLITRSEDLKALLLWDAQTGRRLRVLRGLKDTVMKVSFSPDGSQVVAVCGNSYATFPARIWDIVTRRSLPFWHTTKTASGSLPALNVSWRIVTVANDFHTDNWIAIVWSLTAIRENRALLEHKDEIQRVAFSPDGSRVATGSYDMDVRLWDTETGLQTHVLSGHRARVRSVKFSPDGSLVLTASSDKTATLWDSASGRFLRDLRGHTDKVVDASFSPDGLQVVTASEDCTARIWNMETGRQLHILREAYSRYEKRIKATFSEDGTRVVTESRNRGQRAWDAKTGAHLEDIKSPMSHLAKEMRRLPWQAISQKEETTIVPSPGGFPAAWWPSRMSSLYQPQDIHPRGATWAIGFNKYLAIFTLEGFDDENEKK